MPFGSEQWMYASGGFYPYEIDQSLRFNDDDSAYLNRTPASAGNRKTWTWSGWVKKSSATQYATLLCRRGAANDEEMTQIYLDDSGSKINFSGVSWYIVSAALLRDVSAWYHVVCVLDTTQANGSDRAKIYINGAEATVTGVPPDQNLEGAINRAEVHNIGRRNDNLDRYFDGYMAEVNFIDGQALDPTSFGEFKSGVWIPKSYSGSYGTNGFYLDFGNSGSLGADSSGNSNNWTPTNLAATDQVLDSPTNNFCTLNSLNADSTITFAEGNLYMASTAAQGAGAGVTFATSSGKWYYETAYVSGVNTYVHVGVIDSDATVGQLNTTDTAVNGTIYRGDGNIYTNTGSGWGVAQTVTAASTGDIIGVAYDLDSQTCTYYLNGVQLGSPVNISYMNPEVMAYPLFGFYVAEIVLNFGQDSSFAGNETAQGNTDANGIGDFYYAPPAGYLALCTANLPDPAIDPAQDDVPADYFNTVLYSGNGSTQSITGVGFQPDFVWVKTRTQTYSNHLADAVRGANNILFSNLSNAESARNTITAFNADGFSVSTDSNNDVSTNASGQTFVAWNWLAGNGTASNTDGTITSTVSANQKAGFSIVSYTGNGSGVATVGHGLNSAPDMVIVKNRDTAATFWPVYHSSIPSLYLTLNTTDAGIASQWISASTNTIDYSTLGSWTNTSGNNYIAYCFHSVEGFSKFGSYTGNASTDGPFVYTGFRPAFVMVKSINSTNQWYIYDTARDPYNPEQSLLIPNSSGAEFAWQHVDYLSNGFKIKSGNWDWNYPSTIIYMAFAEMPFKYSNAR